MNGLTNYITEPPWEDTITTWFVLIADAYQRIVATRGKRFRVSGPAPSFTDSEVIPVALIMETFFHGNEELGYAFVRQYLGAMFPKLLDLDRFTVRRRALVGVSEASRCELRDQKLDRTDPVRLVDSAPVTVVTYMRGARCRRVVGSEYFGVVTSKKGKGYGFRLHATATLDQVIDEWVLAPSSIPDPKVLDELVWEARDLVLIGDKIYHDAEREERPKNHTIPFSTRQATPPPPCPNPRWTLLPPNPPNCSIKSAIPSANATTPTPPKKPTWIGSNVSSTSPKRNWVTFVIPKKWAHPKSKRTLPI